MRQLRNYSPRCGTGWVSSAVRMARSTAVWLAFAVLTTERNCGVGFGAPLAAEPTNDYAKDYAGTKGKRPVCRV